MLGLTICHHNENDAHSRLVQLIALSWGALYIGLVTTVPGPALPSLKELLGVSEGDLGLAFSVTVGLAVLGSALAPWLERWLGQSLALGLVLLLCVPATSLSLALSSYFPVFATFLALHTCTYSASGTLLISRVYVLYGKEAGGPSHLIATSVAVGALVCPFLASPFTLSTACLPSSAGNDLTASTLPSPHHNQSLMSSLEEPFLNETFTPLPSHGCVNNIYWVFVIIGCIPLPSVVVFLFVAFREKCSQNRLKETEKVTYGTFPASSAESSSSESHQKDSVILAVVREPREEGGETPVPQPDSQDEQSENETKPECDQSKLEETMNSRNWAYPQAANSEINGGPLVSAPKGAENSNSNKTGLTRWRYRLFILLLSMVNTASFAATTAFTNYLTVFGMEVYGLSQKTMGVMTSVSLGCFAAARLLGTFLSLRVGPGPLMAGSVVGLLGAGLVLEGWGRRQQLVLWVGAALWNASIGPLFGSLLGWGQLHITMTTQVVSLLMVSDCAGVPLLSAIVGGLVEWLGPHGLTVYALGLPVYLIFVIAGTKVLVACT